MEAEVEKLNYDPTLCERIGGNINEQSVVMNDYFSCFGDTLKKWMTSRRERMCVDTNDVYSLGENPELLNYSKEHAKKHSSGVLRNNVFALVHPFFVPLLDMDILSENQNLEIDIYLGDLMKFLREGVPKKTASVVLFDELHSYASASSLIVESGLVDRVIFTRYDGGRPLPSEALDEFSGKKVFWSGAYMNRCLDATISSVEEHVGFDNFFAIKDLYLQSHCRDSLFPESISYRGEEFSSNKVLSISEAAKLMEK